MKEKIDDYISQAEDLTEEAEIDRWQQRVYVFLESSFSANESSRFKSLGIYGNPHNGKSRQLGYLDALSRRLAVESEEHAEYTSSPAQDSARSKKIFVVHGHDSESKETTSRFIEKLGLEAIVLHEKPNEGLTIIEKFEQHADVAYAVILLTPDDIGYPANDQKNANPRARQNVVLELGYFLGRLGRSRVCALNKGNVEIPSDYQGVLYVEMDDAGAWKNKLAQEIISARIEIDLSALL